MREHPSFVVALPMYNEEAYAESSIKAINNILEEINIRNAIVAINDGSRDNTLSILIKLKNEIEKLNIVDHGINQGYGAGIKSAYKFGIDNDFDYVLFMDADLTQDPIYIFSFIPYLKIGIDFIKASRYIRGSRVIGVSRFRKIISILGNSFAKLAFRMPVTDYTNGFRAVRVELARQFNLESNHFEILVEEIWQAKYLSKSFSEINYTLTSRAVAEDSKFSYNFTVYQNYLKYCLYAIRGHKPEFIEAPTFRERKIDDDLLL